MNVHALEELKRRVNAKTPHADGFLKTIDAVFGISAVLGIERNRLSTDKNLSEVGRETALKTKVKQLLPQFAEVSRPYRVAKAHNERQREAMRPKVDGDPIAEMRRQEVRTYLRGLPQGERLSTALAMAENDKEALAIIDASPRLSGLTQNVFDEVRKSFMERNFGQEMKKIDAVSDDLLAVEGAMTLVRNELSKASGMLPQEFEKALSTLEGRNA